MVATGYRPDSRLTNPKTRGHLVGLPSEPGRGFCQDLPLDLELAVLPAQADEFLFLRGRQAILSHPVITIGLGNPVANSRLGRFELRGELCWTTAGSVKSHDLLFELFRIWWSDFSHVGGHLLL